MHIEPIAPRRRDNPFGMVAEPFLQQPGLAFSEVLSADQIRDAFATRGGLFASDGIYSTPVVLWAFLAQALRDGKGAACAAAVCDIATYMQQTGGPAPSGDTGDYCRARAKLDVDALQTLVRATAEQLEQDAEPSWLWHGLHPKLIDGFTFTMPDTPENQRMFPQQPVQRPGAGCPIARACVVLSLATAAICGMNYGPYKGKQTGENALLRGMLDTLHPDDVTVFDRQFSGYMMLSILQGRGVHFCARLHQRRHADFRKGKRLGRDDHLVTWRRPVRPPWMTKEQYAQIPETMTVREIRYKVTERGRRTETLVVVTSLTDPVAYPPEAIAELYGYRWNAELDIRDIKQTLGLDHMRCKSPAMVARELWVTLLAYNLTRRLIAISAAAHDKLPRQLGFTLACQVVLSSWMLLVSGVCLDADALWCGALKRIAANEVANRPGRIEPRALKRDPRRYPMMHDPRAILRQKCLSP